MRMKNRPICGGSTKPTSGSQSMLPFSSECITGGDRMNAPSTMGLAPSRCAANAKPARPATNMSAAPICSGKNASGIIGRTVHGGLKKPSTWYGSPVSNIARAAGRNAVRQSTGAGRYTATAATITAINTATRLYRHTSRVCTRSRIMIYSCA